MKVWFTHLGGQRGRELVSAFAPRGLHFETFVHSLCQKPFGAEKQTCFLFSRIRFSVATRDSVTVELYEYPVFG